MKPKIKPPKKKGRPLKINANDKKKIIELAKFGLTDAQISSALGFGEATLNRNKKKDPEFWESLKRSKEIADEMVEKALFRRAIGYEYTEEFATKDGAVSCERVAHPDVTACIFWLKNRKPQNWKDKHEHDLGDELNNAATSVAQLFRRRYDSEAKRLAAGEDPALVLFGCVPPGARNGNGNGSGTH